MGAHEMFPSNDQYNGEFPPAIPDGSSQNTRLFPESSLPATESMDSAIVDSPAREVSLWSGAIKVLRDSQSKLWSSSFKCRKCNELNWFDPDDQSCSAQIHRIYHSAAVDVVADNLENVLGWPRGTWNVDATSSKMESFHIWMYVNRDRYRSRRDEPGNALINRKDYQVRLGKMLTNRSWRRKRRAESKNSGETSLSVSELTPTVESTVSEAGPIHVGWSSGQIQAFREKLIEWMRTAPQADLHKRHDCNSCPETLWYHPGSCEHQSHSVYNSAAIVVVGEYLERNGYGGIEVEDCHIRQYLKNNTCRLDISQVRQSQSTVLAQRRYKRRHAREAHEAKNKGKGPSHSPR